MLTAFRLESLEVRVCVDSIAISPTALATLDLAVEGQLNRHWRAWSRFVEQDHY